MTRRCSQNTAGKLGLEFFRVNLWNELKRQGNVNKILFHCLWTLLVITAGSCGKDDIKLDVPDLDFKQEMRDFVQDLSAYAKTEAPGFIIVPQNGEQLVSSSGEEDGSPASAYLAAIDGQGREDLFYGYDDDNKSTPGSETAYMAAFLDLALGQGKTILVTDYCWTHSKMDDSYARNHQKGYISFAANDRELRQVPDYPASPYHVNNSDVQTLKDVRNFLYLINPEAFQSRQEFVSALAATNYDLILMDYFFSEDEAFSSQDIALLKTKANGGKRLVLSYLSIGEAENYRYYWDPGWLEDKPSWLAIENPDWPGNYKVFYWDKDWQDIIFGNDDSYLHQIISAGFDGAYLDIVDAFEFYEELK